MISITLFGLSKSLTWALLARSLGETHHVHEVPFLLMSRPSAGALSGNVVYAQFP